MPPGYPRPLPFAYFSAYVAGIVIAAFLSVTVLFTSSDGFDATLEAWEAVFAPRPFALRTLHDADRFLWNPDYPRSQCHAFHSLESAWQYVRSRPDADSLFQQLYLTGSPLTRLLALAGLKDLHSPSYGSTIAAARSDSALVDVLPPYPEVSAGRPVSTFVRDSVGMERLIVALGTPTSDGCAR